MDINAIKCNIHNKFDIEVIDGKTGKIKEKAEAYNIVLDNLWHYIIETTTGFGTSIQYGSGTGTPSTSDTSLFNRVNGIGVTHDSLTLDMDTHVATRRCHINLGLTTSVGVTITEVGLAAGTGNGTLTTHAALQDMNGNPISILKTEFDIINIYATVYCHWSVGNDMIFYPKSGFLETLVGMSNALSSMTMGFGFGTYQANTSKTWSRVNDLVNKTITYTLPRLSQAEGNINGIVYLLGSGSFQGIALKQGSNTWNPFTITNESVGVGDGTTTVFKTKCHFPYNATVYINGVAQSSGVTVLKLPCDNQAMVMPIDTDLSDDSQNKLVYSPTSGPYDGAVVYNPLYNETGTSLVYVTASGSYNNGYLYASNDLVNWTLIASGQRVTYLTTYLAVPAEYKHYKYFRTNVANGYGYNYITDFTGNIVFDTPPADGDVITIDYTTDCIPKDEDHVMDATVTFQFGDYTPSP